MLLNEVPWVALFWVLYANGVLLAFVSLYIYEYFERQPQNYWKRQIWLKQM
jgi:hypothetical protein